jgi:putative ABC transport system permease protein
MLDGFGTQAGVRSASASDGLPFGFGSVFADTAFYATPDHASAARTSGAWSLTPTIAITTEFFPTVGMRLARGRAFMVQDTAGAPPAAIVSEEFARETFRSTDVVGRTLVRQNGTAASATARGGAPPLEFLTIVGVSVDDEPWPSTGRARSLIFVPFAQRYQPYAPITLVVRARDAATGVSTLRTTIRRIDPDLAITSVGPGSVLLEGPFFLLRVISEIATALGLIALVLAMAGLFGVLSHVVAKRTREIGVRLAMGAERRDIFRLILRDGLHPVGKGLALGLGIGVAARIAVKTFVVTNVAAIDPWPLLLLPIPFVLAAAAACYFPAARASRVDPAVVLRDL